MRYVFDTSPLSTLFKNYYRARFPSLWLLFDELLSDGRVLSTREVIREIEDGPQEECRVWARENGQIFTAPSSAEGSIVADIFKVRKFRENVEMKKLLTGGRNADPFVVARAVSERCSVVTMEVYKPNSAKIPNICKEFGVSCFDLEGFMEEEGWRF